MPFSAADRVVAVVSQDFWQGDDSLVEVAFVARLASGTGEVLFDSFWIVADGCCEPFNKTAQSGYVVVRTGQNLSTELSHHFNVNDYSTYESMVLTIDRLGLHKAVA